MRSTSVSPSASLLWVCIFTLTKKICVHPRFFPTDHLDLSYHAKLSQVAEMSDKANLQQKTYHKKATGAALNTVKKHVKDHDLKLFGSCFW